MLINKYKKVIVLFDFDEPGIKAMERYKELYPEVEYAVLPMSKDPSDSIKDYGPKEVYVRLVPILNKKIINDFSEKCGYYPVDITISGDSFIKPII